MKTAKKEVKKVKKVTKKVAKKPAKFLMVLEGLGGEVRFFPDKLELTEYLGKIAIGKAYGSLTDARIFELGAELKPNYDFIVSF